MRAYDSTYLCYLFSDNPADYVAIRKMPLSIVCSYATRVLIKKRLDHNNRVAEMRFQASLHGVEADKLDDIFPLDPLFEEMSEDRDFTSSGVAPLPLGADESHRRAGPQVNQRLRALAIEWGVEMAPMKRISEEQ